MIPVHAAGDGDRAAAFGRSRQPFLVVAPEQRDGFRGGVDAALREYAVLVSLGVY